MEIDKSDKNRFWSKVDVDEENKCWDWQKSTRVGYGAFKLNGKVESAHRVSYVIEDGSIQKEKLILHECDNKKCVNPNHLYEGTYSDNLADRMDVVG